MIAHRELRQAVLEEVPDSGFDTLILTATHTHSGPGGYLRGWLPERVTGGEFNPETLGQVARAAAEALNRALADLAPAVVTSGEVRLDLAVNRRRGSGPRETALPILQARFPDGRTPVLVFGYGAHPTVISPDGKLYSADYVGAARNWLEARGVRSLFLPGPLGDQQPAPHTGALWDGSVERQQQQAAEVGARLGRAVLDAVPALPDLASQNLAVAEHWTEAPPVALRRFCTMWWFAPFIRGAVTRFVSTEVPLQALRVGGAVLIALPAEPGTTVGNAIRRHMPGASARFVVSLSNDWLGYVVSADEFEDGGYEACLSLHGPGFAAWLVEEAAKTLQLIEPSAELVKPRSNP